MLPYYILILVPMLIPVVRSKGVIRLTRDTQDSRNSEIVVFFAIFGIMLMFRGIRCGVDTVVYKNWFVLCSNHDLGWIIEMIDIELGYPLLSKLISLVTSEFQWVLIITAALSVAPICWLYKKEASIPILTILLFTTIAPFSMYFSGIRQALAMAWVVPAWYLAKERKLWKFLLCVAGAMVFHKSAIVIVALYPLYSVRITLKWLAVVLPIMLGIYLFNERIFSFLVQFMWKDYSSVSGGGASTMLILLIGFALYAFLVPDEKKVTDDVIAMRNILLLAVVVQCFAPLHPLAMRMNYYFLLFVPLLIPKAAQLSGKKNERLADFSVALMTVFFAVYFVYRAYTDSDILHIYPYTFFWE